MTTPDIAPRSPTAAHVVPFVLFLAFLVLPDWFTVENPELPWWKNSPKLWVYPLQTIACLAALAWYWKNYTFRPFRGFWLAALLGLTGIAVWITPQLLAKPLGLNPDPEGIWQWLGFVDRTDGFDPTPLSDNKTAYLFTIAMRFVRMAICVPLIEEIFWRGYLMRVVADPNRPFEKVPFGTHTWPAYFVTTVAFIAIHHHHDYLGAAIYGSLTYFVAVRTKSLAACVLMHAIANLALGLYILKTGQWGFW